MNLPFHDDRERHDGGHRIPAPGSGIAVLGPPRSWPACLKSSLALCLGLRTPAAILWGEDSLLLFNDAYRTRFAPDESAFGSAARDPWKPHWDELEPILVSVRKTGASIWLDGPERGDSERARLLGCVSFVPLRGDAGETLGVFCNWPNTEPLHEPSHAMDDFVIGAVAHELRHPLGAIANLVETLRGDAPRAETLGAIDRVVGYMTELVEDLFDDACRGRDALRLGPLCVADVIRDAVAASYGRLVASQCSVSVAVPESQIQVVADRRRLVRALANLLSNTARITPPRRDIEVFARQAGDQVEIGVRESQLDASRVRALTYEDASPFAAGGLGLGFWLAKRIALAHDGSFRVSSDGGGRGATISMHLPEDLRRLQRRASTNGFHAPAAPHAEASPSS